jgi:hypothetical protein
MDDLLRVAGTNLLLIFVDENRQYAPPAKGVGKVCCAHASVRD